jgi:hydroxyacyl-ACP dehydratase HTD2-like protein with hotdog domain
LADDFAERTSLQGAGAAIDLRSRPSTVDEVTLFLFSAATWVPHRIHYDRDYARAEGHADIVVHGPLQGAYLAELLSEHAHSRGGELASLSYRHRAPAYCNDDLSCSAIVCRSTATEDGTLVEYELEVTTGRSTTPLTTGHGRIRLPAAER